MVDGLMGIRQAILMGLIHCGERIRDGEIFIKKQAMEKRVMEKKMAEAGNRKVRNGKRR